MNVETMQTDRRRQHLIFIGLFLLLQVIFIWRSFYGFNTADEMYFIGCSERIFRGEKILIDEWNPTQQLSVQRNYTLSFCACGRLSISPQYLFSRKSGTT